MVSSPDSGSTAALRAQGVTSILSPAGWKPAPKPKRISGATAWNDGRHFIAAVRPQSGTWRTNMGEVIRFVPKAELERARLIREARARYDSIFPPADSVGAQRDQKNELAES
jgi:hypothetical protein